MRVGVERATVHAGPTKIVLVESERIDRSEFEGGVVLAARLAVQRLTS